MANPGSDNPTPINSSDEAAHGSPSSGKTVCPVWDGSGQIDGADYENYAGTGRIVQAIGGA